MRKVRSTSGQMMTALIVHWPACSEVCDHNSNPACWQPGVWPRFTVRKVSRVSRDQRQLNNTSYLEESIWGKWKNTHTHSLHVCFHLGFDFLINSYLRERSRCLGVMFITWPNFTWDDLKCPEVTFVTLEMTFTDEACEYVCVTTLHRGQRLTTSETRGS